MGKKKYFGKKRRTLSHHHMRFKWHNFFTSDNVTLAKEATLPERSVIVGHVGMMLLSFGTGAWRVRTAMNTMARNLNMTCSADIGLVSLEYTCVDESGHSYTQALSLPSTGVNTSKLNKMEAFVSQFEKDNGNWTIDQIHNTLEEITNQQAPYKPWQSALAAGIACGGFTFLLGGWIYEVIYAFFGAMAGSYVRRKMIDRHITLVANVAVGVLVACCVYALAFYINNTFMYVNVRHLDGYIGAMLFVIPGFPFITSGLDISKIDMRSGLERMAFASMIIMVATAVGWVTALILHMHPQDFLPLHLNPIVLTSLRLFASFCGVFGFSITFNTEVKIATLAAVFGAMANTLRLSLVDFANWPPAMTAFLGAFLAGMLASIVRKKIGYPRIALTVPAIVIMVPGLYMYRSMFNLALGSFVQGEIWAIKALMIVISLPLGLIAARILTDPHWRHAS